MKQSGNALFLILIAVALFAALSYAVTQSGRGGGSVDREIAEIHAAQIVQHAQSVKNAVDKVRLLGGASEEEICFASENWEAGLEQSRYDHSDCGDVNNNVFASEGGYAAWARPDPAWMVDAQTGTPAWAKLRWIYTGDIAVQDVGSTEPELLAFLGPVKREVCTAINQGLGVDTSFTTNDYVCCGWDIAKVFGFTSPPNRYNQDTIIGDQDSAYAGKLSGCAKGSNSDYLYYFWNVLIER